jgi:hypothetical protein
VSYRHGNPIRDRAAKDIFSTYKNLSTPIRVTDWCRFFFMGCESLLTDGQISRQFLRVLTLNPVDARLWDFNGGSTASPPLLAGMRNPKSERMKARKIADLEIDLRRYLQHRRFLILAEMDEVLAELNRFTSAIIENGFRMAIVRLLDDFNLPFGRPFIEVCDAIIRHQLRTIVEDVDRNLARKSLFEAYLYYAGTEYAFEPAGKTRLGRSLRKHGVKGFAELFLSLHLFNIISLEIQDRVAATMSDPQALEVYMLTIEAVCRDIVARSVKNCQGEPGERWAAEVRINIEAQLLSLPE